MLFIAAPGAQPEISTPAFSVLQNAHSRNASTEADAAVYNPAGTAFAKDGLQISIHNQHYFKYDTLVRTEDGSGFTADDGLFYLG